jgi:hypothetical protein
VLKRVYMFRFQRGGAIKSGLTPVQYFRSVSGICCRGRITPLAVKAARHYAPSKFD